MKGVKYDKEKRNWSLLPFNELNDVVDVMTVGAKKYERDNWMRVPNARDRYFSATMRHLVAWWNGERDDEETGKSHLAHAVCCILFLMWHDKRRNK